MATERNAMTKFKVGDRVRLKAEYRDLPSYPEHYRTGAIITGLTAQCALFDGKDSGAFLDRLEPAPTLIDPSKKYRTRDGREVLRILCTDAPGPYPVVALLASGYESACVAIFTSDGRYLESGSTLSDLIEAPPQPKQYEGWVNVYRISSGESISGLRSSKREADEHADCGMDRIACLHLTFTEGEGL
jgi:hypothetical protein